MKISVRCMSFLSFFGEALKCQTSALRGYKLVKDSSEGAAPGRPSVPNGFPAEPSDPASRGHSVFSPLSAYF